MKSSLLSLTTLLCGFALSLTADQITLKNGDRVSGKIVTTDDKTVTLKTDFAGEIKIDRTLITGITTDAPINVTLKDAGPVQAKISGPADELRLQKSDGTAQTVKADSLVALRDDAAQRAWEREEERLRNPRLNDFWSGFVTLGVANASGNSSTTSVATAASATRIAGRNKMSINFAQIYARQSTTIPFGETANRMGGSFRIDRDISKRVFVFGVNAYDYDKFLDLNLRMILGGGFGYHVWQSKKGFFDVSGGGNWNRETFDVTNIVKTGVYTTQTRNSGELMIGQEFGYQPLSRLKFNEKLAFFPNFTDTGEYRMNFDTTASIPLYKWLEFNVGFSSRYLTNPPVGKVGNDTILSTGIRASFDQTKR
jgi:putative salt-induced outer membrane protein